MLDVTEISNLDAVLEELWRLQNNGICQEEMHNLNGYGQVRVADEYHLRGGL